MTPSSLSLDGIRILDLSRVLAGPFCGMLLADLGADVVKVEDTGTGDESRTWPPHKDGESAAFTFKEFELLQYLVLREGRTIERTELVTSLWQGATEDEAPGERTIDVHVRRLRAKLGRYEDIVRTVRGVGYRFDRHADVVIRYGHGTPSPDRF